MKKITINLNLMFALLIAGNFTSAAAGNNAGGAFNVWPDTGQEKCYSNKAELSSCPGYSDNFYGQDAQYQGHERSYTKLGYGGSELEYGDEWLMTRDNVTKLMWEIKTTDDSIHDKTKTFTWCDYNDDTNGGDIGVCDDSGEVTDSEAFIQTLNDAAFGGFSDWRLPTVKELSTLIYMGQDDSLPAVDGNYFPNTVGGNYWSATTLVSSNSSAWLTCFADKCVNSNYHKFKNHYLRAVRGGITPVIERFTDNGDGTVTDRATNLMWQKCSLGQTNINGCQGYPSWLSWEDALSSCESLELAGYDDWYLPNRNELQSLVDYSTFKFAIDTSVFPDMRSPGWFLYWTSTTQIDFDGGFTHATYVDFDYGVVCSLAKQDQFGGNMVRAVRKVICSFDDDIDGDVDGLDLVKVISRGETSPLELEEFANLFGKIM